MGGDNEYSLVEKKPMRNLTLRIYNGENLLYHAEGRNEARITNVTLFPTNKENSNKNYFIEAKFDLSEWPEAGVPSEETNDITWILTFFGTDNVLFIKDTRK